MTADMFVNVSNHPLSTWPALQREAAEALDLGALIDLPGELPLVSPELSEDDVGELADHLADRVVAVGGRGAFVSGEYALSFGLVSRLFERGVRCFCAAARRSVREATNGEGHLVRESVYQFVQLREYAPRGRRVTEGALPFPAQVLRARLVAPTAHRLQPMVTTGLHGAIGHALKELACLEAARPACEHCSKRALCGYAELFEGPEPTEAASGLGVTSRAPPSMILAPAGSVRSTEPIRLAAGDSVDVELVLLGANATAQTSLVIAALREAARRGIGGEPRERIPLELQGVEVRAPGAPSSPATSATLELRTPMRVVDQGHVRGELEPHMLWRSVVRRLEVLSLLHHGERLALPPGLSRERAPFAIVDRETRQLQIRRFSSRQQHRMELPGIVGNLRIEGESLPLAWKWLEWAGLVGVGKATSLGFGRFSLRANP